MPPVRILKQANTANTPKTYFLKIHLNIIMLTPTSCEWFLPFHLKTNILHSFLISPMRARCSIHLIPLDLITCYLVNNTNYAFSPTSPCYIISKSLHYIALHNLNFSFFTWALYVIFCFEIHVLKIANRVPIS